MTADVPRVRKPRTPAPIDAWERQPRETARSFEAFRQYRDADPSERALTKVAATLGVTPQNVGRWSADHGWVARAAAYDVEKDRIRRLAAAKAITDMGARQAAAGALMQTKGLAKIRSMVNPYDAQGNPVELKPGESSVLELDPLDAARLVEAGVRLERVGRGEGDPYTPQIQHVTINAVFQLSVGAFMRENPTMVGPTVHLLEELARLMDKQAPEPKQVGPGTEVIDGRAQDRLGSNAGDPEGDGSATDDSGADRSDPPPASA